MTDKAACPVLWPEWLTPEYTAMKYAVINEMVRALDHCYASADAAGMDWTKDGWLSISADNILGLLKRNGNPPPNVGDPQERRSVQDVEREWWVSDFHDEEPPVCPTCNGTGTSDNTEQPAPEVAR